VIQLHCDINCSFQYPMYSRDYVYARKYKVMLSTVCCNCLYTWAILLILWLAVDRFSIFVFTNFLFLHCVKLPPLSKSGLYRVPTPPGKSHLFTQIFGSGLIWSDLTWCNFELFSINKPVKQKFWVRVTGLWAEFHNAWLAIMNLFCKYI